MPTYNPIVIPPGVVRLSTSRAAPNRWYDSNLVRWRDGVLTPIGGWTKIDVAPLASTPRVIYGWLAQNGSRQIVIGCDGHFYSLWEETLTDITPEDYVVDETTLATGGYGTWDYGEGDYGTPRIEGEPVDFLLASTNYISMDHFGERLMAVSQRDGRLLMFDPALGPIVAFKEVVAPEGKAPVPLSNRGVLVTPERFVVLIGADGYDRRIAWCSREDYLDWNFSSLTNTAGFLDVESSSALIAAKSVRGGTLIFSQSEVYMLAYKGIPAVYGVQEIESNSSLLSAYSVACFDGRAMWPTRTGFKMFDGGYIKPINCDIEDFFIRDLDPQFAFRTHAVVNNVYAEVTWYYCSQDVELINPPPAPVTIKAIDDTFPAFSIGYGIPGYPFAKGDILGNDIGANITIASIGTYPLTFDELLAAGAGGAYPPSNCAKGGYVVSTATGGPKDYLYIPPIPGSLSPEDGPYQASGTDSFAYSITNGSASSSATVYVTYTAGGPVLSLAEVQATATTPVDGNTPPGVPNAYITYNYEEGWWSKGRLSRTAGIPVRINHDPILADGDGVLYRHEVGEAFGSEGAGRIYATSGAVTPAQGGSLCTINGILPDSESGFDSTQWTFRTKVTPEGDPKIYGPYKTRSDGYTDTRFTARQVEIEVEQIKPGRWTLGKPEFDIKARGKR